MTARHCALCPLALLDDEETHCAGCAPYAFDPWYRTPSPPGEAVLRPSAERDLAMTDPARRAVDLTHDAVDALAASLQLVQANPSSKGDGGLPAFDAVLAGISAYLLDPVATTGTLAGIDGERKAAAAILLEATDDVRKLALYRLAQEAHTRDVKVSLEGIAGGISATLDEPR